MNRSRTAAARALGLALGFLLGIGAGSVGAQESAGSPPQLPPRAPASPATASPATASPAPASPGAAAGSIPGSLPPAAGPSAAARTVPGAGPTVPPAGASVSPVSADFPPNAPDRYIGLTLPEVYLILGVPAGVHSQRGEEPWQDDVIFRYANRLSLFWFRDRVWQVRLDDGYEGEFLGVRMGTGRARVRTVLGAPVRSEDDWDLFTLDDRGYPVRARFFYEGDRLLDAYVYRGDF